MRSLPIFEIQEQLLGALKQQRRLILTAPTGSGKSTQVPQMLLDGGLLNGGTRFGASVSVDSHPGGHAEAWPSNSSKDGQMVILQPRRLPTRLLAAWVAKERGVKLGAEVGYQIRLDNVTSSTTRIRYVTEGVLLRQMLTDSKLPGVAALIFDEFHERHLYGDITLARALQIQETTRPDLIIIVMSATLDVGTVEKFLAPCAVLSSQGRTFPVTIEHLTKSVGDMPVWDIAAEELRRLTLQYPEGDALLFMPGTYEISRTVQAVRDQLGSKFVVFPLHGELSPNDQDAAVARYDLRKVVVATNVAETSLTIDGVRLVVDSGLARIPRYDPHRGINTLLIEKISRASADQRAGRAGRTAPGHCLRLWTQREHEARPVQELPEVKRLDLSEVVLTLKASGVADVKHFRWLEPPEPRALERAEMLLEDLGALSHEHPSPEPSPRKRGEGQETDSPHPVHRGEGQGEGKSAQITETGRRMLAFPLHPRYARMMLAAQQSGCVRPIALIAALTQGRNLLVRNEGRQVGDARDELFGDEAESDFFILMRAWRYADRNGYNVDRCRRVGIHAQSARQVGPLYEQFLQIAEREGLDVAEKKVGREAIQRCVLAGFADHVAQRLDVGTLRCALVHGRRGVLARESVVKTPLFVAAEVAEVQGKDLNVLLSLATAIKEEWLRELFPEDFTETNEVMFDATQRRVTAIKQKKFRDLVLDAESAADVPLDAAAKILAREIYDGRCVLKDWDEAVEQWIIRVNRLREWMPDLQVPEIRTEDRQALLEQICHGAVSYKEVKERDVWPAVKGWLSKQQQTWVEQYAPERIELPGGRRAKIVYAPDKPPTVAARIQDLYGVREGLWIADRRVSLVIQILAPNNRPVQVTQNLAAFWKDMYPKLKLELQHKYPKHLWR